MRHALIRFPSPGAQVRLGSSSATVSVPRRRTPGESTATRRDPSSSLWRRSYPGICLGDSQERPRDRVGRFVTVRGEVPAVPAPSTRICRTLGTRSTPRASVAEAIQKHERPTRVALPGKSPAQTPGYPRTLALCREPEIAREACCAQGGFAMDGIESNVVGRGMGGLHGHAVPR